MRTIRPIVSRRSGTCSLVILLTLLSSYAAQAQPLTFPPHLATDQAKHAWLSEEMMRLHDQARTALDEQNNTELKASLSRARALENLRQTLAPGPAGRYWLNVAWIIAVAFVIVHALSRFNSPPTGRTETTLGRYWAAASAYAVVNICAWGVLVGFPDLLMHFLTTQQLPQPAKESMGWAIGLALPAPFVSALVITSLVPHVESLAAVDHKVRVFFYDLASIPAEALRLTTILRRSPMEPDDKVRAEVENRLNADGFALKDIVFGVAGPDAQRLWTKLTTTWPWILVAGTTAFLTSLIVDNRVRGILSFGEWSRWIDAGIFAVVAIVAVVVVRHLLDDTCPDPSCKKTFIPTMWPLLLGAGVAGAVIGWCVPTWSRDAQGKV